MPSSMWCVGVADDVGRFGRWRGNQGFVRRDEVELAWQWCDQIRQAWQSAELELEDYAAGSNGPKQACNMIETHGHRWYEDC